MQGTPAKAEHDRMRHIMVKNRAVGDFSLPPGTLCINQIVVHNLHILFCYFVMLSIPTFQYNCKNITEPVKRFHPYLLYERTNTFTEGKLSIHTRKYIAMPFDARFAAQQFPRSKHM